MANVFKEAKKYQRKHPRTPWQDCIAKVSKRHRQTGRSNKKRDRARTAKPPGIRRSKTGRVYSERRKNRSDAPGKLSGLSEAKLTSELKGRIKEKINNAVVKKYNATKKRTKKFWQTVITTSKQRLNKLQ